MKKRHKDIYLRKDNTVLFRYRIICPVLFCFLFRNNDKEKVGESLLQLRKREFSRKYSLQSRIEHCLRTDSDCDIACYLLK